MEVINKYKSKELDLTIYGYKENYIVIQYIEYQLWLILNGQISINIVIFGWLFIQSTAVSYISFRSLSWDFCFQ